MSGGAKAVWVRDGEYAGERPANRTLKPFKPLSESGPVALALFKTVRNAQSAGLGPNACATPISAQDRCSAVGLERAHLRTTFGPFFLVQ